MVATFPAIVLAAFSLLVGEPEPADELVRSWATAGWHGGAYRDSESGYTYCLLWHNNGAGSRLQIGRDQSGYRMVFVEPESFEFETDLTFRTQLPVDPPPVQIDSRPIAQFELRAYASNPDTLVVELGASHIMEMKFGTEIRLVEWGLWYGTWRFDLVIDALDACYGDGQ